MPMAKISLVLHETNADFSYVVYFQISQKSTHFLKKNRLKKLKMFSKSRSILCQREFFLQRNLGRMSKLGMSEFKRIQTEE